MAVFAGPVDVATGLEQRLDVLGLHDLQHLERVVAELVRVLVPQRAIAIDQKYVKAHNNLGVAYLNQRKIDAAASEFRTALALDPRNVESLVNLSLAEKDAGRRDEARAALAKALEIDPHSAEAHYNLAVLLDDAGDKLQAQAHYRAFMQNGATAHPDLVTDVRKRLEALDK